MRWPSGRGSLVGDRGTFPCGTVSVQACERVRIIIHAYMYECKLTSGGGLGGSAMYCLNSAIMESLHHYGIIDITQLIFVYQDSLTSLSTTVCSSFEEWTIHL